MSTPSTPPSSSLSGRILSASPAVINKEFVVRYQRYLVELFPFEGSQQFQQWILSDCVYNSWMEYIGGFTPDSIPVPTAEEDKATVCRAAQDALRSRDPKFRIYRPDKTGWTEQDHVVRFIVSVISGNFLAGGLWSVQDFEERPWHYTNFVCEIMTFLWATFVVVAMESLPELEREAVVQEEAADSDPYDESYYADGSSDEDASMGGPYARLNDESDEEPLLTPPAPDRANPNIVDEDSLDHADRFEDEERFDGW